MNKTQFLPGLLLFAGISPLSAALLVYEGFNGYTADTSLSTLTPNAFSQGLAKTGDGSSYSNASGNNLPANMKTTSTGLTFGSLQVSGGAVTIGGGTSVAQSVIEATTSSTTVWGSYLVALSKLGSTGTEGFELRLNSSSTSSSSTPYFRMGADTRLDGASGVGVSYDGGYTTGSDLAIGTTYLILSKFNFDTGGGATLWVLTVDQFEDFVEAGRSESFLTSDHVTARVTDAQNGTFGWNGNYLEFVSQSSGGTFDEIRFGETLLDVTPVPEPGSVVLSSAGALLCFLRRRKR